MLHESILVYRGGNLSLGLALRAAYHTSGTIHQNIMGSTQDTTRHAERESNSLTHAQWGFHLEQNTARRHIACQSCVFSAGRLNYNGQR